jgi:hypothetical protein
VPDRVIYTNTMAFKKALLRSDIQVEERREIRLLRESYERMKEEQAKRENSSLVGTVVGGAIGFAVGGPGGANIGAKIGSTAGRNYKNDSYTSIIGSSGDYIGKFKPTSGYEAWEKLFDEASDAESDQDKLDAMSALSVGKDLIFTDWDKSLNLEEWTPIVDEQGFSIDPTYGGPEYALRSELHDNWFDMNLGEKVNYWKEYKQPFNMRDFTKALNSGKGVVSTVVGDPAKYKANFGNYMSNDFMNDMKDIISLIDPVDYTADELETINNALNQLGFASLSLDAFNAIVNLDQDTVTDESNYPEDFEW